MSEAINNYKNFVDTLTSQASKDHAAYVARLNELQAAGCDIARLDTAVQGLSAEAGEAEEIVKKMKYQGKPWNEENRFHLKREAGDIIFYWMNLCIALGYEPMEIIEENVRKLEARYPGGKFDVNSSEHRKAGDL